MQNDDQFETSLYSDYAPAERAVERLRALGYGPDDISVVTNEKTRDHALSALKTAKGSEGVATGATVGGVLGAILAGLTATGSIAAIAGTGGLAAPLVAGPLAAALAGLGAGGVAGGLIGGLTGVGIGQKRAAEYEKGLAEGGILVAIRPRTEDQRDAVRRALNDDRETQTTRGEIDDRVDYAGETRDRSMRPT